MALGSRFDKFITGYETCFSKNSSLQNKYVIHVHLYKISEETVLNPVESVIIFGPLSSCYFQYFTLTTEFY